MSDTQQATQLVAAFTQLGLSVVFLVQWWLERQESKRLTNLLITRDQNETTKSQE